MNKVNLYSKRFTGIEIEDSGKVLLIRNENSDLISYIDTVKEEFKFKGNITSNSLTLIENSGIGNDKIILNAPSILSNGYTLTLPIDEGNSGEFLKTDGSGILSWGPEVGGSPGGIDNSIQLKSGVSFTGFEKFLFDGTTLTLSHSSLINNGQIFISPNYDHSGDVYDLDVSATDTVHIGRDSGLNLAKINSVGLGLNTGKDIQGENSVAIGNNAGVNTQGDNSVAIGYLSASNNQKENSIAIGTMAGFTTQGENSISIGNIAGNDKQKDYSIAIGANAGNSTQGENSIAIGRSTGSNNQGDNSIAVGYLAGGTSQIANSIILNASGLDLVSVNSGLFIDPLTNATNNATNILFYDSSTKEIKYDSNSLISGVISKPAPFTVGSDNITLTIANILSGILRRNMGAVGTWTLPTAALSVAAISGASINDALDFYIVNENTAGINDITLAIGAGGTMIGNVNIPSASITGSMELSSGHFRIQFTNVGIGIESYNCFRLS